VCRRPSGGAKYIAQPLASLAPCIPVVTNYSWRCLDWQSCCLILFHSNIAGTIYDITAPGLYLVLLAFLRDFVVIATVLVPCFVPVGRDQLKCRLSSSSSMLSPSGISGRSSRMSLCAIGGSSYQSRSLHLGPFACSILTDEEWGRPSRGQLVRANNNTFTWSAPCGVCGFTGQPRVARLGIEPLWKPVRPLG
jgi:hypothetical protein